MGKLGLLYNQKQKQKQKGYVHKKQDGKKRNDPYNFHFFWESNSL